jgi:hypothetical protein
MEVEMDGACGTHGREEISIHLRAVEIGRDFVLKT